MIDRILSLVWWVLAAVLLAWFIPGGLQSGGSVLGAAALGGGLWWFLDTLRAARLVRWLRQDNMDQTGPQGGFWGDLSDRIRRAVRRRERAVRAHEDQLQDFLAAMQASPNGVMLLLEDGRIEWFNSTAAQHFGLDPARDLQQHVSNLVRDPVFVAYLASDKRGGSITMQGRQSTVARSVRLDVQMHAYGQGRYLLLSRDITAIEQADTMRRDFVANVSHEIRTPLTVLTGFVETLQSLPLSEDERGRYLQLMAQQAQRMQTLVSDLLTLSRLEGSPLPAPGEWVTVAPLLAQCVQEAHDLSSLIWGEVHELRLDVPQGLQVSGSAHELHSALGNLIGNAVRYSPASQPIDVRFVQRPDGSGALSVRDHGPGIAPEHLPRLTERFYRVDRSRSRETGGTGLGLAIVKHVLQRHGAQLAIESQPGQGSTFTVVLPADRYRLDDSQG